MSQTLKVLMDQAWSATALDNTTDYEPQYFAVLTHVERHAAQEATRKRFYSLAVARRHYELVAFCMRGLRWPEVLA